MRAVVWSLPDLDGPGIEEPSLAGPAQDAAGTGWLDGLRWALSDVRVLAWRTPPLRSSC